MALINGNLYSIKLNMGSRDSAVAIAIGYGLEGQWVG
jgi:hypothetical protein